MELRSPNSKLYLLRELDFHEAQLRPLGVAAMNVQHYVDQLVMYFQTPIGWVVLAIVIGALFFMLKGNQPGR